MEPAVIGELGQTAFVPFDASRADTRARNALSEARNRFLEKRKALDAALDRTLPSSPT